MHTAELRVRELHGWDSTLGWDVPLVPGARKLLAQLDRAPAPGVIPVGYPGKVGLADVEVLGSEVSGLGRRFVKAPLSLSRALYVDPADRGCPVLYMRTTGGGIGQNDRLRQHVVVQPGARVLLTTQAATLAQRMDSGYGASWLTADVHAGGVFEYLPGHTALAGGSRLVQHVEVKVEPGAQCLLSEVTLAGRLARGEECEFDLLSQVTRVQLRGNLRPLYQDVLTATGASMQRPLLWGADPVWGTLVAVPADAAMASELVTAAHDVLRGMQVVVRGGATTMVSDAGAVCRIAGAEPQMVKAAVHTVHDRWRQLMLGKPAVDLRQM